MARARRPTIQGLARRPVLVANTRSRVVTLGDARFNVGSGSCDLRLPTAIAAGAVHRTTTRKTNNVPPAIRTRVRNRAAIGSCLAHVFTGSHGQNVLRDPGRPNSTTAGSIVARSENHQVLLIAANCALHVAGQEVIFLSTGSVGIGVSETPGVRADACSEPIGLALEA